LRSGDFRRHGRARLRNANPKQMPSLSNPELTPPTPPHQRTARHGSLGQGNHRPRDW
jgi:hypothetical protein